MQNHADFAPRGKTTAQTSNKEKIPQRQNSEEEKSVTKSDNNNNK